MVEGQRFSGVVRPRAVVWEQLGWIIAGLVIGAWAGFILVDNASLWYSENDVVAEWSDESREHRWAEWRSSARNRFTTAALPVLLAALSSIGLVCLVLRTLLPNHDGARKAVTLLLTAVMSFVAVVSAATALAFLPPV
ncbi:hypothetical protein [Parenemella sanctibonifatiensis]|uniref:Uncharacterized protein n=1 Tax=Parenemella sanctibonifatiensis TaxID=2016505 RepID=A0A255ENU5_9ACTN|nr:hypothetical protein [Parenemella sanctibonifatiensis]OYN92641.1 hypothetical protein CGZ91_03985 [Parenemella sanctibonifatiensis]